MSTPASPAASGRSASSSTDPAAYSLTFLGPFEPTIVPAPVPATFFKDFYPHLTTTMTGLDGQCEDQVPEEQRQYASLVQPLFRPHSPPEDVDSPLDVTNEDQFAPGTLVRRLRSLFREYSINTDYLHGKAPAETPAILNLRSSAAASETFRLVVDGPKILVRLSFLEVTNDIKVDISADGTFLRVSINDQPPLISGRTFLPICPEKTRWSYVHSKSLTFAILELAIKDLAPEAESMPASDDPLADRLYHAALAKFKAHNLPKDTDSSSDSSGSDSSGEQIDEVINSPDAEKISKASAEAAGAQPDKSLPYLMRPGFLDFTDGYSVSSVASSLLNTLAREDTEEIDFAIRYLDLAVERGILSAQLTATQLYSGLADYPCVEGRDRDLPRAVRTGCMAADNGCLTSMFIVCHHFSFGLLRDGGICLDGEGAGEDEDDSTPAGAVRHPAEQVLLFPDWFAASRLYLHYIMLSEDVPATSLAQYLPSMISRLGSMYLAGGHGLLRSIRSAVPFLEMAHRMGDLESTGRLAFIYAFAGYPYIPRDLQRAQVYFSIIRRFDPSFPMPSTQELNAKYRDYKKAMDEKMGISQPASSSSSGKKKSKRPAGTKDGKDATKKDAKGEESSFPWIIPASVAAVAAVSMVVAGLLMSRR